MCSYSCNFGYKFISAKRAGFVAVQIGFNINLPPAKPGKVILALDVTSMEQEQIDALIGDVKACASGLQDGFDIGGYEVKAVFPYLSVNFLCGKPYVCKMKISQIREYKSAPDSTNASH